MVFRGSAWFLSALAACSKAPTEPAEVTEAAEPASSTSPAPEEPEPDAPLFVGLSTRDYEVWLHYGTEEDLYTIKAKDGRVLADQIDDARLKRDYPDLHEMVHGAVDVDAGEMIGIGYSDIGY